jgi:hypothetical protein
MTATGFPVMAPAPNGREIQSMAFFRAPDIVPLYSGVTRRSALAD